MPLTPPSTPSRRSRKRPTESPPARKLDKLTRPSALARRRLRKSPRGVGPAHRIPADSILVTKQAGGLVDGGHPPSAGGVGWSTRPCSMNSCRGHPISDEISQSPEEGLPRRSLHPRLRPPAQPGRGAPPSYPLPPDSGVRFPLQGRLREEGTWDRKRGVDPGEGGAWPDLTWTFSG